MTIALLPLNQFQIRHPPTPTSHSTSLEPDSPTHSRSRHPTDQPKYQYIACPPLALIVCPVIHPASALHNQATTCANSYGVPTLCSNAVFAQIASTIPGIFLSVSRNNSLSTAPGVTQFTVVPCPPSSCAKCRVMASRPALLAA